MHISSLFSIEIDEYDARGVTPHILGWVGVHLGLATGVATSPFAVFANATASPPRTQTPTHIDLNRDQI